MSLLKWRVIDSGKKHAQKNMDIDAELLDQLANDQNGPILHLYGWDGPSATYGHFIDPYHFIQRDTASKLGLQLAKRPTGGGMIFHLTDLAFSILVPASHPKCSINVLENYAFVNSIVIETIKKFTNNQIFPHLLPGELHATDSVCKHFCMAKPTRYDVISDGRKIGGGAQRRTKYGFLHQGSISLAMPPLDFLNKVLIPQKNLVETMQSTSYELVALDSQIPFSSAKLEEARRYMSNILSTVVHSF